MRSKRFLPLRAPLAAALLGLAALGSGAAAAEPQDRAFTPGRQVSDQDHARLRRETGENRSFEELFGRATAIGRGEYLGVEPDVARNVYRFKFMRPGGNVVWVDMDGRTGRVIAARQ